jgi:hypothetical protein
MSGPVLCVAKTSRVSLVERSPSTVTLLKVRTVIASTSVCRAAGAIRASVATKASMVAISGAIMPEPLAIPPTRTVAPSTLASAKAPLGKVSVVEMARAACSQLASPCAMAGMCGVIFLSSRIWPITPVEASITSVRAQPTARAAAAATWAAALAPALPVKELAQPALTTRAQAAGPFFSLALHQSTGAEPTPWRVKTPATTVPASKRMSRTSSRSCL